MSDLESARGRQATIFLALGATCISFAPVFVKLIDPHSLGPTAIGFWRTLFGAIFLFGWAFVARRPLSIPGPARKFAVLAGFFFSLDLAFWHRSIFYTGAGMATILGNTQIFATSLLAWLVFKEKLTLRWAIAAVTAILGVSLLVGVWSKEIVFSPQYVLGVFFGVATGVWYACFILSIKAAMHQSEPPDPISFMAWASAFTALFMGIGSAFESHPAIPPDLRTLVALVGVAIVAQAVGWRLISGTLSHVRAAHAALIILLQPILATVWGFALFGESLGILQIAGALVTLGAIYYGTVKKQAA
jgi:drug/metabolite transporter (DMT)-like permease